eukprot:1753356-Pleurochrysis_carterae.AAC.1
MHAHAPGRIRLCWPFPIAETDKDLLGHDAPEPDRIEEAWPRPERVSAASVRPSPVDHAWRPPLSTTLIDQPHCLHSSFTLRPKDAYIPEESWVGILWDSSMF